MTEEIDVREIGNSPFLSVKVFLIFLVSLFILYFVYKIVMLVEDWSTIWEILKIFLPLLIALLMFMIVIIVLSNNLR